MLNDYLNTYCKKLALPKDEEDSQLRIDKTGFFKASAGTTNPFNEYYDMKRELKVLKEMRKIMENDPCRTVVQMQKKKED